MSAQDSPFQALEKLVVSPIPGGGRSNTRKRPKRQPKSRPREKQTNKQEPVSSGRAGTGKASSHDSLASHPSEQTSARSVVRSARRVKVRYAFEFYQDQIFKLKELRRAALLNDEDFSMSEVVRTALDNYLDSSEG
jgi:hypothetical protein